MYVFFLEFSNLKCQAKLEGLPPSANDLESTDLKLFKFFQAKVWFQQTGYTVNAFKESRDTFHYQEKPEVA